MFDLVEKHKRLLQIVLVLIAVPFMFFGLEAYTRGTRSVEDVARVDDASISQREFAEELRSEAQGALGVFGERALRLAELADFIVRRKF